MPVMTRSARHSETAVSTTDSNAPLNDRDDLSTQRGSASSRQASVQERGEHKSNSDDTAIASPQLIPSIGGYVDEKSARLPPSGSSSSSTISRFVDRLEASVYSLSSLRTIPSWRSTLPRAHKTYAKIEGGHDGAGASDPDSTPGLPHPFGGAPPQHSSFGNLWNNSVCRQRDGKRPRSQNNAFHTSLSDILARFSHAMTSSTNGHHDPGTSSSSSSLGTHQSSSLDSHIPFPSTSEESSYPSPYSADAVAVFQAPLNKGDPSCFDGYVKHRGHRGTPEARIQVVFAESTDRTSTGTGTSATSARAASKPRGRLVPLRRRVRALAGSMTFTRCKFPTIFRKHRHPPYPVDDDNDPVEYDIPCLAYITCLW